MKTYFVYVHVNKINNKKYVGITSQNPSLRWGGNGFRYTRDRHPKFNSAIKKYGWDNFEHIILEKELSYEEAITKEKYYIKLYDSFNNGYNSTLGGEGTIGHEPWNKSKNQIYNENTLLKMSESKKGNTYRRGKKCTDEQKVRISESHKGLVSGFKGRKHKDESNALQSKPVGQYTMDGELIKVYYGANKAAKETGLNQSKITLVCQGKRNQTGGFKWKYQK